MTVSSTEARVMEIPVTRSYTITAKLADWVVQESKRRGISASAVVRECLERAALDAGKAEAA